MSEALNRHAPVCTQLFGYRPLGRVHFFNMCCTSVIVALLCVPMCWGLPQQFGSSLMLALQCITPIYLLYLCARRILNIGRWPWLLCPLLATPFSPAFLLFLVAWPGRPSAINTPQSARISGRDLVLASVYGLSLAMIVIAYLLISALLQIRIGGKGV